jgi:type II secretory ATPase GspE/PulE/Tfp pilus assembly ATPase PilB-like protein
MKELSLWCRELGLMLRNGTDLAAALSVLECQDFSRPLRAMTTEMIGQASRGAGAEDLIAMHAEVFPVVVRCALGSGRAGGRVPETLVALADALHQASELGMTLSAPADEPSADPGAVVDQAPVVRLVNKMLWDAAEQKASEVHIHASESAEALALDFRMHGEWRTFAELPLDLLGPVCRRLCIMAGINWVLKQPSLGTLRVGEREDDVRGTVQFLPGDSEAEYEVRVTLASARPS